MKNSFILLLQAILRNLLLLLESPDLISDSSSESETELEQVSHQLFKEVYLFYLCSVSCKFLFPLN